ncbi:MAG: peroxidase-related enzyme [Saprospiraceae bacterium]|nr:peroxidase-related enzyme [Saprospiraceae bacterium]
MRAYIDVIDYDQSTGTLREIYDNLIASRGKLAHVHMIQSLNPESIVAHMDLYLKIMFGKSPLRRYQREMIGVVVSQTNDCAYCVRHHAEALNFFWKDADRTEALAQDFRSADLSATDLALCSYAESLTANPNAGDNASRIDALRDGGLSDRQILDASLVAAYFNFVNRLVLGLGVEVEVDGGGGYRY